MSDRRLCRRSLLLGCLALSGCGFAPAYRTQGAATPLRNAVAVFAPATEDGFALSSRLVDRFGPVQTVRYGLTVTLEQTRSAAAINADGDTTRLNLRGIASWTLADADGQTLLSGTAQTFTSYSASGSTVATQTAAADAATRLSVALADLIVADIIARAGDLP